VWGLAYKRTKKKEIKMTEKEILNAIENIRS